MASNPIGEIPVLITGDFSELQDSITNAVSVAEDGAQSISSAFDISSMGDDAVAAMQSIADAASSLQDSAQQTGEALETMGAQSTEDLTNLADAAQGASTAVSEIADSSGEAASGLNDVSGAASEAASSAEEAGGGLQDMAEQLAAVGEGLAITEGLKEFGEEALTAYGAVQTLTIGLTALTGSAETADSIVEDVKNLAATQPFAFPEIAPTIQRMVAMGVAAGQVDDVMQAVGGAAAATGEQFSQVAQMFDRMSISGTANTRSMATLGLSTTDLGNAMGVTADEATAAFKALDQSARIDALTTALAKFAGVAEAEAQGVAGQWQIFQNQFEEVMVGVGQALAPAVEGVLAFGKSVMEGIQQALDWFNQLPLPIQEVAGALGLVIPAVVLLTTGLSALGFAAIGVQGAITAASAITKALGLSSGEAAAAEQTQAVAAGEVAEAETAAAAATQASATASTELATATEASAASQVAAAEAATGLVLQETALSTETAASATALGTFLTGLGTVASIVAGPIAALLALQSNLGDLKDKYQDLYTTIINEAIGDAIRKGATLQELEQVGYTVQEIKGYFQDTGQVATSVFQNIQNATTAPIAALNQVGISTAQIQTALKGIQVEGLPVFALLAGSSSISEFEAQITALGGNLGLIIQKLNQIPASTKGASSGFASVANDLGLVIMASDEYTAGEQKVIDAQDAANQAVKDAHDAMVTMAADLKDGYATQDEYNRAVTDYDAAVQAASPHSNNFATSIAGIEQAAAKAQQAFTSSVAVYNQVDAQFQNGTATLAALSDAYSKAEAAAKKAGDAWGSSAGEYALLSTAFAQSQATFSAVDGALDSITQKFNDGAVGVNQYLDAYTKWQAAAKGAGDVAVTVEGQVAALTNAAALQTGTLDVNIQAWGQLYQASLTNANDIAAADAAFKLVKTDAGNLGVTITQVGQGFTVMSQAATPAAQAAVKALADMMTQAGLTVQTIQNGIPVVTDAATGITTYGQTLDKATGTVIDAKTGIIQLNAVLPQEAAAHQAAAAAAGSHATALNGLNTAALNVAPSLFNAAQAAQNLTNNTQGTINTLQNSVSVFEDLASQTNLTVQQQLALNAALKQVESAASAMGVQVQFVGGQLQFTTTNGGVANTALQGLLDTLNQLTADTPATTSAQDALAGALQKVASSAKAASDGVSDLTGADSQDLADMPGVSGSLQSYAASIAALANQPGSPTNITGSQVSGVMQAAGYYQTGNTSYETYAQQNAQIQQEVDNINAMLGSNAKEIATVTSSLDQFGNQLDTISYTTNPNYSASVVAATTATTAQTTATVAQTTATTDATTATTDTTAATAAQTTATTGQTAATQNATQAVAAQVPVVQTMGTTFTDMSGALSTTIDAVGTWTTTLSTTGQQIVSAGIPTVTQLESLGLSASDAAGTLAGMNTDAQDFAANLNNMSEAVSTATEAMVGSIGSSSGGQTGSAALPNPFSGTTDNSATNYQSLQNWVPAAAQQGPGGVGSSSPTAPLGWTYSWATTPSGQTGWLLVQTPVGAATGSLGPSPGTPPNPFSGTTDNSATNYQSLQNFVPAAAQQGPGGVGSSSPTAPLGWTYSWATTPSGQTGWLLVQTPVGAADLAASQITSAFGQTMNLPAWEQQQINMMNNGTWMTNAGANLNAGALAAPQTPSSMTVPNMTVGTLTQTNPQTVQPVLNLTVQAGNILGDNGIQQFSSMIMQQVTTLLRQTAGQKLS